MASWLEQLKTMTVVVADTGDIKSIEKFRPQDTTTNPSLITQAAGMPEYAKIIDDALVYAKKAGDGDQDRTIKLAIDRCAVEFGLRILKIVPGRVSTEVDARLSFDTQGTVAKAHELIAQQRALAKSASSSRSPPPGRASAPPNSSKKRAFTAT
jgi:transaldolase